LTGMLMAINGLACEVPAWFIAPESSVMDDHKGRLAITLRSPRFLLELLKLDA